MAKKDDSDTQANEAKARQLVHYAREQAEPTLQAERSSQPTELPSDLFPGYTIVANISRGGQGRVYEAIDNSTQRRVAIKVPRSGPFIDDAERGRFEREIRILAQLQHPNIVTIHSSGTVTAQRYFVMDFIDGQPLGDYVSGNHLTIEQTLHLFLRICDAVNAAHLRGIVHRDLKPGNIQIDDHGEPHVLDFGLAKAIPNPAGGAVDSLDATVAGQFVGSLPWSAPEQVMNTPDAIDLRTDVYGLGLLLYFMLTQSFPYERRANLVEMTDRILRSDPARPSSLRREINDELDTIVLMCLNKEPDRRYQIAGELARDVKRYLAGEPIEAKRDSSGYLLAKMLRRHRGLAMLVTAFVGMTLVYAVTMSLLYQRASKSERLAETRAADVSEQNTITRETIEFLVEEVSGKLKQTPGNTRMRRDILEGAFDRLLPLVEKHNDDPRLRADLMRAHYQLGDIAIALTRYDVAESHLQKALDLRLASPPEEMNTPEALSELSIHYVLLGDVAQNQGALKSSEDFYRRALAIDERLAADYPDNATFQDNLAWSYDRLGWLATRNGDAVNAEALYAKQLGIMQQLVEKDPNNATRLDGLAAAHARLGQCASRRHDWEAAANAYSQAVEIGRRLLKAGSEEPLHWFAQINRCCAYDVFYRFANADAAPDGIMQEAHDLAKELVRIGPELPRNHDALIQAELRLLMGWIDGRDPEALERHATKLLTSIDTYLDIAELTPSMALMRSHGLVHLSRAQQMLGRETDATDTFRQAIESVEAAVDGGVDSTELRIHLADMFLKTPDRTKDQRLAAIGAARRSLKIGDASKPTHIATVGRLYHSVEEFKSAIQLLESAERAYKKLGVELPTDDARVLEDCRMRVEK